MFVDLQVGDLSEPLTGRSWRSGEARAQIFQRAAGYCARGVQSGNRVFLFYGNNLEFFSDLLALWHLGASVVPVDIRLTNFEIENLARMVKPQFTLNESSPGSAAMTPLTAQDVTSLGAG